MKQKTFSQEFKVVCQNDVKNSWAFFFPPENSLVEGGPTQKQANSF